MRSPARGDPHLTVTSARISRSTAHLQQPIPVLALVSALVRLRVRREEQLRLQLKALKDA